MLAYRTCFESPATPGENASNDPSEAPTSRRENMNENGTAVVGLSRMVRLGQIPCFLAHDYETGGAQL